MGGVTSHNAIKGLDLYAYAGEDHVFNNFADAVGFGNPINLDKLDVTYWAQLLVLCGC